MPHPPRATRLARAPQLFARIALVVALLAPAAARAQGVPTRPTRPPADTSRAGRDTARVHGDTVSIAAPPRDSIKVDSSRALKAASATNADSTPRDTVKAPIAHSELPTLFDAGDSFRWSRDEIFASGALSLLDLLDRVPGLTGIRAGFLAISEQGAYLGDVHRVRVFLDGLELDGLDPRASASIDLASIQLWALEDVVVERGASELRVHLRTLRARSTTPYTRTDALTGDNRLTLFRGFYGKRGRHGEVGQFGVQQFGLGDARNAGGSALGITGRVGWARGRLSLDAYAERVRRDRDPLVSFDRSTAGIPAARGTGTTAYLRAAYGDPDAGPWLQALAGTLHYIESSPHSTAAVTDSSGLDFADTTRSRAQYVIAGGFTRGALHVSATDRARVFGGGRHTADGSARASLDTRLLSLGGFVELRGADSVSIVELSARLRPLPFVSLAATVGRRAGAFGRDLATATDGRFEGALRIGRGAWIGGGLLVRDSTALTPLSLFGFGGGATELRATGTFVNVRGRVYRSIYADAYGIRWNGVGLARPRYESRSQIYLSTRWLTRFPSGNFGVLASLQHEYRSRVLFVDAAGNVVAAPDSRVPGVLVEVRIVSAVLSYQYRNFTREQYQLVPGILMPRGVNVYGVRWEFFN